MTYHYNVTRYRSLKDARLWTDRIFLSLLLLIISVITFYNSTPLNLSIGILFITLLPVIMLVTRRHKVPFVEIVDGTISYFDSSKGEMVSVQVHEITHVSTRFCQLDVHTAENIHSLNLGLVRNEKKRWEIKEMIREMARRPTGRRSEV